MQHTLKLISILTACLVVLFVLSTCSKENGGSILNSETDGGSNSNNDTLKTEKNVYDVDKNGIPHLVKVSHIELDYIERISKFRSGIGHNSSDDFESCRSMKHYFQPKSGIDWSIIKISSPVKGTVSRIIEEWAGTQIQITSEEYPAFTFTLFHVNLNKTYSVGEAVESGQLLGTHINSQTMADISVGVNTPKGWKLISYFDTIDDLLLNNYKLRGVQLRSDFIIGKEARDAEPLSCDGETFLNSGQIENWVVLN